MPSRPASALRLVAGDAAPGPRKPGSRRPHRNETVARVRKLVETTPLTYREIAAATGVAGASICRWTRDGQWRRHLFAPRATDTVPRERAGARLKLRTLAARLAALAERYIRELEETPGVDLDKLGEALALYQMAKLASLPRHRPRKRKRKPLPVHSRDSGNPESLAHAFAAPGLARRRMEKEASACDPPLSPRAPHALRMFNEMRAAGIDPARPPEQAVKDYVLSRAYEDPELRPRNRTKRERREAWMREKE
jgi:hypothetical protein